MIAENETERTFTLDSRPWVKPVTKPIYAVGIVEALVPTEHPSAPIQFEITANGARDKVICPTVSPSRIQFLGALPLESRLTLFLLLKRSRGQLSGHHFGGNTGDSCRRSRM